MAISSRFEQGKLLSELSTFKIGGPARFFIEVHGIEEMQEAIAYCNQEKIAYFILGKGSNCLFDDRGFNGLVIHNKIAFCEYEGNIVFVGSGYSFSLLGVQTARKGLSGLEFASGIPATVGGAIYMNAGASGTETCHSLKEVTFITERGDLEVIPKEKILFSYRFSSFQTRKGAIAAAKFELKASSEARQKQIAIVEYRSRTQPYGEPSAGCVFCNPQSTSAGALIQKCQLKGIEVGGAQVSPLHANFIVNKGNATAKDVLELAEKVRSTVKEQMGIEMKMEIRYIPYE